MTTVTSLLLPQGGRTDVPGTKAGSAGAAGVQNFLSIITGMGGTPAAGGAGTLAAALGVNSSEGGASSLIAGSLLEAGGDLALRGDLSKGLAAFEKAAAAFLGEMQVETDGTATELPEGALEAMAQVIGSFLASFDADAGTAFTKKLEVIGQELASLSANPGAGIPTPGAPGQASGDTPTITASAREVAGLLMGAVSQALGVVRVVPNNAPTATQTLLLSPARMGAEFSVSSEAPPSQIAAPAQPLFELPDGKVGALQKFLSQAAKGASDGKSILDQIASAQSAGGKSGAQASPVLGGMPKVDYARLDMLGALHGAHSEPVDAPRFEAMLSQASRAQGAEHAAQQAAPRFATLMMAQIKNATFVENRTRIELAPRGLGDIQISVETDPSGRVTAMVRAENPQVLELLRTDRAQLEAMLAERGFDLAQGGLDFEGFGGHEDGDGDEDAPGSGMSLGDTDMEDTQSDAPGAQPSADGHLNILA